MAQAPTSGVAVEQLGFVRGFVRLCSDGWGQGWHERNGGNLTYRMTEADASAARPFFNPEPSPCLAAAVLVPHGAEGHGLRLLGQRHLLGEAVGVLHLLQWGTSSRPRT